MHLNKSHLDSDRAPLDEQPRVRVPRQWRRLLETVGVVGSLFLGGLGTGYFWSARNAEVQALRQREDHLAEIARLRETFDTSLKALPPPADQPPPTPPNHPAQPHPPTPSTPHAPHHVPHASPPTTPHPHPAHPP